MALLFSLSNFAFNVILYFTILMYFLSDGHDLVDIFFKFLKGGSDDKESKQAKKEMLNETIRGVFNSSIQTAVYQALYTWMLFDMADISYVYIYTLVAAFFKIIPIVSTSFIGIAGGIQMYLAHDRHFFLVAAFILAYIVIDSKVSNDIYKRQLTEIKPTLMGMSVFLGYYAFDFQGIFYGPLLICLIPIVYNMFK